MTKAGLLKTAASAKRWDPVRARITILMVLCGLIASAVVARAVTIQIIKDKRLASMAKRQFQSKVLIRPRRGTIADRNGEPLAVNVEIRSLAANPSRVQNRKTLARLLAKATNQPFQRIYERLRNEREFAWIKRHLKDEEIERMRSLGIIDKSGDLATGLWMIQESKRVYPHGELAAHVLGDVNLDSEGLEGVELWANEQLRGKVVSVAAVKDALGRPTFIDAVAAKHVKDGDSVALTIDASLQYEVEQSLKSSVFRAGARSGTAIVMDAMTGEILAMANEPSFNPNDRAAPAHHRRNRAVTDGYEPGSTVKAILLASALQHGWKLSDRLHGEHGSITIQGKRISEAEAHERFEWISLKDAIKFSSNVVSAKLALKVGTDHYYSTLKNMGIGAKTGLGFPGEISGRIPAKKDWQPLSLANIGFGQGIMSTPIQMLRAYAAFANGGWLVQPTILKTPLPGQQTDPPKRVLSDKVAHSVVEALKAVTDDKGTGIKARVDGYQVAGKTGTSQVVDPATKRYSRSRYISSFIGFPVGIEPRLVIYTSIDEPKGIYYSSETAAPLFAAILSSAATRFSLPAVSDPVRVLAGQQTDQIRTASAKAIPVAAPSPAPKPALVWDGKTADGELTWFMPSLSGLSAREAIRALQGHRFQLEVHGVGIVKSQSPDKGKPIAEGGLVKLTLGEP